MTNNMLNKAAEAISSADCLFIVAGAGMGVDSGLADFQGNLAFWNTHPALAREGLTFQDMATPQWFFDNPRRAWGFYGYRHQLYKRTQPHQGFQILKKWAKSKSIKSFVYTTNIDGHFQKAGFSQQLIYECHGSINCFQCCAECSNHVSHRRHLLLDIDTEQLLAKGKLPSCQHCNGILRPNILMRDDSFWLMRRAVQQEYNYKQWKHLINQKSVAIIELGVGVSRESALWANGQSFGTLIRINPIDAEGDANTLSIRSGALEALLAIDKHISQLPPRQFFSFPKDKNKFKHIRLV